MERKVLELLEVEPFDLVLLDLQMPVMGGVECALKIRGVQSDYSTIPLVAMTAAVSLEDRERCEAAGMNGFVGKPFERDQLLETILHLTKKTKWMKAAKGSHTRAHHCPKVNS